MRFVVKTFAFISVLAFLVFLSNCRNDFDYSVSQSPLRFSQDTIFLDTVYTQYNSETYLLKVYNEQGEDIIVPTIQLTNQEESQININVDGQTGYTFNDVLIREGDSLQIFIQSAVGDSPQNSPIYIDGIEFTHANSNQTVPVFAFIEPVKYWKDNDLIVDSNTTIEEGTSHFVIGDFKVTDNAILNIEKNVNIYFYNDASLSVSENSELHIEGDYDSVVKFRTERNDARYDSLPGLWRGISIEPNATLNANHLWIQNATNGIEALEGSVLNIQNTQIYNSSKIGLHAVNSRVDASNLVISNAGSACLAIDYGGEYNFYFSSFNNDWPSSIGGISGYKPAVYLSDYNAEDLTNVLAFNMHNSVMHSSYANSIILDFNDNQNATLNVTNSVIENNNLTEFDYSQILGFQDNLYANPLFKSVQFWNTNLSLQGESPALNFGDNSFNTFAPLDIKGTPRDSSPNAGAYE